MDPYEYQFENLSTNSLHWHNKASDLFTSAMVLWEAMDNGYAIECWSTYKMLMAYLSNYYLKQLLFNENLHSLLHIS